MPTQVMNLRNELDSVLAEITARNAGNSLGTFPGVSIGRLNQSARLLRLELADQAIEFRNQHNDYQVEFRNRRRNSQRF